MSQAKMEIEGAETISKESRNQEVPKHEIVVKTCTKCLQQLKISNFYWNKNKNNYESFCKECVKVIRQNHYQNNYNKVRECNRKAVSKHQKKYPERNTQKVSLRRAKKLKAVPKWLSDKDKKSIKAIYKLARELSLLSDTNYVVDHIVPLQGDNVCGLHVPWNLQVITAIENLKKGNQLMI